MRIVGLVVDVRASTRPACTAVLCDDPTGVPAIVDSLVMTSADEDLASQLRGLHVSLESRLRGMQHVDRVVVRRADVPPRPSNKEGPRLRLLAEGALIAAAAMVVPDTRVGAGLDLGRWHGTDKASVDREGAAAVEVAGIAGTAAQRAQFAAAAAAAMAGYALG